MMRGVWLMVAALLLVPVAGEAQAGPDRERREQLERQVRRQFMGQIAERLELTEGQREQVREVLDESAEARVDLRLESQAVRIDLIQAVRDEDAGLDRFRDILNRLEALREQERAIEDRESAALSDILDARQQAVFLFLRMQFNDRIQRLRGRGGPPGGGPGGPVGLIVPGGPDAGLIH